MQAELADKTELAKHDGTLRPGAALVAIEEHTAGVEFVTFDTRLGEAAEKEGFQILST